MNNPNYNPEKLAEFVESERQSHYAKGHQRTLVSKQIQVQRDPSYIVIPDEEIVDISDGAE